VGEGGLRRKRLGKEIGLEPRMERTMMVVTGLSPSPFSADLEKLETTLAVRCAK